MALSIQGERLPFQFDLDRSPRGEWKMVVHNASETIVVDDLELRGDSFIARMPLFDSEFRGIVRRSEHISGEWTNHLRGPDYHIPFDAHFGEGPRFGRTGGGGNVISGTWETHFAGGTEDEFPAIALFDQDQHGRVTGTFITETGDYRYLEGVMHGDSLHLSGFDGTFALLFAARLEADTLNGRFWSGTHWQCSWKAHRNPGFTLRDPDSLTRLREGYAMVDLNFPDLEGNMVSTGDARFRDKVLIVQVMGSWCPNCVDETRLLNEVYDSNRDRGLEVVSIAFEKHQEPSRAIKGLERFRDALGVRYPILYAGHAGKGNAAEKLPFLEHVMSFPTCIFIDHRGTVRRIRTGIYGPGTGEHYTRYKQSLEQFVSMLLDEAGAAPIAER